MPPIYPSTYERKKAGLRNSISSAVEGIKKLVRRRKHKVHPNGANKTKSKRKSRLGGHKPKHRGSQVLGGKKKRK
jgi:hypothetical protein